MSVMRVSCCMALSVICLALPTQALAQRFSFERSFDTAAPLTLDATTIRGRIDVESGPPGKVTVRGTVTVRVAIDVPADAVQIAQRIAQSPPVELTGDSLQLRPPADAPERRAVTVAYVVTVPSDTTVTANSDSGAITISGIAAPVTVRTQSAAVALSRLQSDVTATSGSGAMFLSGITGKATLSTESSAITLRDAQGAIHIRTRSGAVTAGVARQSDVDIEAGSSAITVEGGARTLRAVSSSGKIQIAGEPSGNWDVTAGSGRIELRLTRRSSTHLELSARSGTLAVPPEVVTTVATKQRISGALGGGAASITAASRSGGVVVRFEP